MQPARAAFVLGLLAGCSAGSVRPAPADTADTADTAPNAADTGGAASDTDTSSGAASGKRDGDGDGLASDLDCNDADASVYPGAPELPDGVDNDCDGLVDASTPTPQDTGPDADADGYGEAAGDCDERQPSVFPGAPEVVDGLDNDCDGMVDEDAPPLDPNDADADGWTLAEGDCNDRNATVHPDAAEPVDGVDNDCDGVVDA